MDFFYRFVKFNIMRSVRVSRSLFRGRSSQQSGGNLNPARVPARHALSNGVPSPLSNASNEDDEVEPEQQENEVDGSAPTPNTLGFVGSHAQSSERAKLLVGVPDDGTRLAYSFYFKKHINKLMFKYFKVF